MKSIPLTPASGGGVCIDTAALNPGDIIVSTTSAAFSKVIRAGTGSAVSHAMLYAGQGQIIDAVTGTGVDKVPLQLRIGAALRGVAYRHTRITPGKAQQVISYAEKQRGKAYDYTGAAGAGISGNPAACVLAGAIVCVAANVGAMNSENKFFCSELVLEAFKKAGIPITNTSPAKSTPQDIVTAYSSGNLNYIGHLKA